MNSGREQPVSVFFEALDALFCNSHEKPPYRTHGIGGFSFCHFVTGRFWPDN